MLCVIFLLNAAWKDDEPIVEQAAADSSAAQYSGSIHTAAGSSQKTSTVKTSKLLVCSCCEYTIRLNPSIFKPLAALAKS